MAEKAIGFDSDSLLSLKLISREAGFSFIADFDKLNVMIRDKIRQLLQEVIYEVAGGSALAPDFSVEVPENPEHGDYATNAAMVLAKTLKKPIAEIARALVSGLSGYSLFDKIEAPPQGFINFWLSSEVIFAEIKKILEKRKSYGQGEKKKERVNTEFVSANPTGSLHLGHGRGGFYGDALANVLAFSGFDVTREYYVNDAKTSNQIKELGKTGLGQGTTYLTPDLKKIIAKLKPKISASNKKNPENLVGDVGYLLAKEVQKKNAAFLKKKAHISFNRFFSEEESLYKINAVGKALVELKEKNLSYERDGAVWFRAKDFGDSEDRVLVRSGGEPTYFLPDLAYHLNKFFVRKFDRAINIWGADHHGYARRLSGALVALGVRRERLKIIITQLVRLVRGGVEVKMSKRKGEFVTLEELIDEVGLDAVRFFFLMHTPDSHMDFDLELAKERSVKNPVYYVQYAHARIASIFKKAKNLKPDEGKIEILVRSEELILAKKLVQFPEVVEDTARDHQVIRLVRYSTELARAFHDFYEKHRVISDDRNLTAARLALVKATQLVLQSTLGLLGVSAPKKM